MEWGLCRASLSCLTPHTRLMSRYVFQHSAHNLSPPCVLSHVGMHDVWHLLYRVVTPVVLMSAVPKLKKLQQLQLIKGGMIRYTVGITLGTSCSSEHTRADRLDVNIHNHSIVPVSLTAHP